MKKVLSYECINGAYHDYACCNTCWNTHPVAEKYFQGEDFNITETKKRLEFRSREREFKGSARKAGFSESEIEFLWKRV